MGPGVGARGVFVFLAIPLGQAPSGGAGGGAAGEIAKVALMSALRGSKACLDMPFDQRGQVAGVMAVARGEHVVKTPLPEIFSLCEHAAERSRPVAGLCYQLGIVVANGHDEIDCFGLAGLQD